MNNFFVLLSGEHPTLPKAEVKAILEAENLKFKILDETLRILKIKAPNEAYGLINSRGAYSHYCGFEIFQCKALMDEILGLARKVDWSFWLKANETFAVRVEHVGGGKTKIDGLKLEKEIGGIILNKQPNCRVNLKNPNKIFCGIVFGEKFVFGLVLEKPRKNFLKRTPRKKPFFHPSSLQPKLARCMVNLSRASKQKILLDPFCGTGTILIEAGILGLESLGCDLRKIMVKGSKINLAHYKVENAYVFRADALRLPLTKKIDCIATDPPYGRAASTLGVSTQTILEKFFEKIDEIMSWKGKICLASPLKVNVEKMVKAYGFKVLETHTIYVHRTLTREIVVVEKG
ncbi:methyltransferase domain-containing protein [Candidatus Bathyarchaeota archaeon]|nr:MAG: methyltransferase domain-containing protein [Candidatus Bathyarchaeota archaeon]